MMSRILVRSSEKSGNKILNEPRDFVLDCDAEDGMEGVEFVMEEHDEDFLGVFMKGFHPPRSCRTDF